MDTNTPWHKITEAVRERHDRFDRQIAAWLNGYACLGGKIHCGKGCANCCSLVVNCTFPEAMAMAPLLNDEQAVRLATHVEAMLREVSACDDLLSWLRRYRQRVGPCPLLGSDNACGIYPVRPASCRSLLATRESRWCGVDFSLVSAGEKEEFLAGLDRTVVAFPLHYVAATQEWGRDLENGLNREMAVRFGFSLSGNLPFLVWLEREHRLSDVILRGYDETCTFLRATGLMNPLLVSVEPAPSPT